jgi:hypothetical protein
MLLSCIVRPVLFRIATLSFLCVYATARHEIYMTS